MPNGYTARPNIRDARFVTIWYYRDGHRAFLWHSYKITQRGKFWTKKYLRRRLHARRKRLLMQMIIQLD